MAPIPLSQLDEPTARNSSPLSSPGSSSDKENPRRRSLNKRANAQMPPPSQGKRRRLTDRTSNIQSQVPSSQRVGRNKFYDPDQDPDERRKIKRDLRGLTRDFSGMHISPSLPSPPSRIRHDRNREPSNRPPVDSRGEYLQPGNNGIVRTVEKLNSIYVNVKQTSDATIDSRLLVNAADLSNKKTAQLAVGESTAGIDVDEFVSKCRAFMRHGPESNVTSTQRRRQRQSQNYRNASDDDDDGGEGDAMNWAWLGRMACLPHSSRPTVSGFLLGPLSVAKRVRRATQRTQTERIDPTQTVQPQDLVQEDLGQGDNNLTVMCSTINKILADTQTKGQEAVEKELSEGWTGDPPPEAIQAAMEKYNVCDDGGISLFKFCINPRSFGQSVENLFYVSFLVRDGHAGIDTDSRKIPTLRKSSISSYPCSWHDILTIE